MFRNKRTLIIVPARGGSKGIPLKNLREIAGRSLVAHAGELIRSLDWVDRAVISTDHETIMQAGVDAGLEAPFTRPPELSGDRIGDIDVLTHAIKATEADDGRHYDIVVMLQPTSPLRRDEQVTACVEKLVEDGLDTVWTVSPTDLKYHPLKQLVIDGDGRMTLFDPRGAAIIARQQLDPVYHRNGAAYALTRECLLEQRTLLGERSGAVVTETPMVSIDTEEDIARVDRALRYHGPSSEY